MAKKLSWLINRIKNLSSTNERRPDGSSLLLASFPFLSVYFKFIGNNCFRLANRGTGANGQPRNSDRKQHPAAQPQPDRTGPEEDFTTHGFTVKIN